MRGIEGSTQPLLHAFVFRMFLVFERSQKFSVSGKLTAVFRRTCTLTLQAKGSIGKDWCVRRSILHRDFMRPGISKVVFVKKGLIRFNEPCVARQTIMKTYFQSGKFVQGATCDLPRVFIIFRTAAKPRVQGLGTKLRSR
jgi:hypothetical protein